MILLHISCSSAAQAAEIVDYLLDEKLLLDAMVLDKMHYKKLDDGAKVSQPRFLIIGTTKALLFAKINALIAEKHGSDMPLLYAMPIVYMDIDQTKQLQNETEKV